jgi:hypothetical protein
MGDFLNLPSFTGDITAEVIQVDLTSTHSSCTDVTADNINLRKSNKLKFAAQQYHGKLCYLMLKNEVLLWA